MERIASSLGVLPVPEDSMGREINDRSSSTTGYGSIQRVSTVSGWTSTVFGSVTGPASHGKDRVMFQIVWQQQGIGADMTKPPPVPCSERGGCDQQFQ